MQTQKFSFLKHQTLCVHIILKKASLQQYSVTNVNYPKIYTHVINYTKVKNQQYYEKKLSLPSIIARYEYNIFCQSAHLKTPDCLKSGPNIIKWILINTYNIFDRLNLATAINYGKKLRSAYDSMLIFQQLIKVRFLIIHVNNFNLSKFGFLSIKAP